MADFEACYFCGAGPDATLATHGVVPAALSPSEDVQRSVTLCPDCREKLVAVLEPVVAAASDDAGPPSGRPAPEDAGLDDQGAPSSGAGPAERAASGGDPTGETTTDDAEAGGERTRSVDVSEDDAEEGVTIARPDDRDPVAGDDAAGANPDEADDEVAMNRTSPTDEGATTDSPGPARGPSAPADASADDGDELTGGDPEAYRKVVRLLQNREFPVQREDIVEVAAGAYDLSPGEVDGTLTTMVQKGLVTEEDGTLRRA
jgi:hypothetical protein